MGEILVQDTSAAVVAHAGSRELELNVLAFIKDPERSTMRLERLAQRFERVRVTVVSSLEQALPELPQADALITIGHHLGPDASEVYRRANRLRWVQSFGTGVDNIKGHADLKHDVAITNIHGVHGPQLSEAAFAGMLSFARHLPELTQNQAEAKWVKPASSLLFGKTVCIVGLGAIANDLAPRCKAFGMRTTGVSKSPRSLQHFDQVFAQDDLTKAAAEADYLIILTPYSASTRHLIGEKVLGAMQPHAILINLSRGGVVDETALVKALDQNQFAGAALDVFEVEPLPSESPLWRHPKIMITPHAAGFHAGYPEQAFEIIAANVARFLHGGAEALLNRV